jgi:RecB family exonuclease
VVLQWLRHERTRLDPFCVEQRELEARPDVATLALRLRLDRVDRVSTPLGERWLVIDYKTGREADQRGWKSDQLREPQLPLYASHAATLAAGIPRVDGICFGHIKDGHPALVARTNWRKLLREDPAADTQTEWNEDLARWRGAMERAARGFLEGQAWLDPRVGARSYYADLLSLTNELPGEEDA